MPVDERIGCAESRRVPGDEGLVNFESIVTAYEDCARDFVILKREEKIIVLGKARLATSATAMEENGRVLVSNLKAAYSGDIHFRHTYWAD